MTPYTAIFSPDGVYRYLWSYHWGDLHASHFMTFVMLNPSTANAERMDSTIRRCFGFAKKSVGCAGLNVVNAFAFRATDPFDMLKHHFNGGDIVGPENDKHILEACEGSTVVMAWGAFVQHSFLRERAKHVHKLIIESNHDGICTLGRTAEGHPRHPLYSPKDALRVEITGPVAA